MQFLISNLNILACRTFFDRNSKIQTGFGSKQFFDFGSKKVRILINQLCHLLAELIVLLIFKKKLVMSWVGDEMSWGRPIVLPSKIHWPTTISASLPPVKWSLTRHWTPNTDHLPAAVGPHQSPLPSRVYYLPSSVHPPLLWSPK